MLREDVAAAEAHEAELRARGMEPMPPRRSPEELAAVEQRMREMEERARRHRELQGEAGWLPEDDDEKDGAD